MIEDLDKKLKIIGVLRNIKEINFYLNKTYKFKNVDIYFITMEGQTNIFCYDIYCNTIKVCSISGNSQYIIK